MEAEMFDIFLMAMAAAAGHPGHEPITVDGELVTVRLELAQYDLGRAEDQHRLQRKIVWAADKVCRLAVPGAIQSVIYECSRDSVADAHRQLGRIMADRQAGAPLIASIAVTAK
jgi:UrcA family protein